MLKQYCAASLLLSLLGLIPANFAVAQESAPQSNEAAEAAPAKPAAPCAECDALAGCMTCADPSGFCFGGLRWNGYVDAGVLCNTRGAHSNNYTNTMGHNGGQFDALYLSGVKKVNTNGCGIDWGAGVDMMFGENYRFMSVQHGLDEDWYTGHDSQGNKTYGFAMPQLYAQLGINDWTYTVGHFYTPLGYEGAKGTDRFFYSRSLSFDAMPVTHTGFTAEYNGFENLDLKAGWVNGINEGFDNRDGGSMFVGSFTYRPNDWARLKYALVAGDIYDADDVNGNGVLYREHNFGSIHSFVLDVQMTERLNLAAEIGYGAYNSEDRQFVVLGEHAYYTVNDCWRWGARLEWEKDSDFNNNFSNEKVELTVGANWTPFCNKNFMVRPELRYDSIQNGQGFGKNGDKPDQICLGFDVIYSF